MDTTGSTAAFCSSWSSRASRKRIINSRQAGSDGVACAVEPEAEKSRYAMEREAWGQLDPRHAGGDKQLRRMERSSGQRSSQ